MNERESTCRTCQRKTGFPHNGYVWCINLKCSDYHTVFTKEEWETRRQELIQAHAADY